MLHYFEGLSTEATAQRLGCPRGTVLSRLSRARSRIKSRLERQGVSFSALIPAGEGLIRWIPPASVPAWLLKTTVRSASALALASAAIENVVPAAVASLSRGVVRTLLLSRIRAAAAVIVLTVAGVSIGLAATFRSGDDPRQAARGPEMPRPQLSQAAKNETSRSEEKAMGERFEYAGLVLDPDGKPTAGAKIHLAYWNDRGEVPTKVLGTTDAEGRFHFTVTRRDFTGTEHEEPWIWAPVVATLVGCGPGWGSAFEDGKVKLDPHNLTIRLARDDVPVEGRIVDLEGRPVAGVSIHLGKIHEPENKDLSTWIAASLSGKEGSTTIEQSHLTRRLASEGSGLPSSVTTDAEGWFSVHGIGRERVIALKISGPTIQTKEFSVLTRDIKPFQLTRGRGSPDWGISVYYGARFTHAAAPTKPVVGVVKDKDTGRPMAGVLITCFKTAEFPVIHSSSDLKATTDRDGRYRLIGLPRGRGNQVIAVPAKGQPYLPSWREVPDSPGLDPVVLDVGLKRGIVIEGRVIDNETGKPLKANVEYNAFQDNPHLAEAPGFDRALLWGQYKTEPDGSFRIVGLPGRGLVSAMFLGGSDQYLEGVGLKGSIHDLDVVPHGLPIGFNTFSDINPAKSATTIHCDLALERGLTRTIRVVDPQGQPVAGARIRTKLDLEYWTPPQEGAEFRVECLRRREKRQVLALLEDRKLGGWVELNADEPAVTELKLRPWATAIGRVVEDDGDPRQQLDLVPRPWIERRIETDSQGRFRIDRLIPGMPIEIWVSPQTGYLSGKIAKRLVLAAGEVKDLGDVKEGK